jgi:DNA-binding MarR family transcriptional regulator
MDPIEPNDPPFTERDKKVFGGLANLIGALVEGMNARGHKSPPVNYVQAFCLVALEEGMGVEEYAARAKVSTSTMSRHLLDIGDRNRKRESGLGLVTSRTNPLNRRKVEYFLTEKGVALLHQMRLGLDALTTATKD